MESNERNEINNSRKSSFTGSTSSKSSSFINVEDDEISMVSHNDGTQWLSTCKTDFASCNSPLPSSFGNASDDSEVETIIDSDSEENDVKFAENSISLRDQFFNALQDVLKKQNPTDSLFDIIFMVENKEIYAHMLILRLCGATKFIKYIEENASDKNNRKIDMNIVNGNQLTFDDLYIFVKSIYFNNVENDLTPSNVMLLYNLGKTFGIQNLIYDCHIYLNGDIWKNHALILLEKANDFLDIEIVSRCLKIISENTNMFLFSPKFLEIKHETLIQLLNQRIFKTDAKTLFDKVFDWAKKNACIQKDDSKGIFYRDILGEALSLIPFNEMSQIQIFEVYDTGILTSTEILFYLRPIVTTNEKPVTLLPSKTDFVEQNNSECTQKNANTTMQLAAFIASKRAIEEQLNTLHNDITTAESNIDNATPNNLQDRINALEAEEARVNAIRSRLSDEEINRNNLDGDQQNELDALHKAFDAAVDRLQNARKNLTDELASAITSEQIQADINDYYYDLAELIFQVHQTLADLNAIPISYHELGQRINDKIQKTNKVIQDANTFGDSTIIQPLNELIPQAQTAENDLATRYNIWLEFVKERDNAYDQVDQARNVLNDFEANINLRPLNVAENQLETLKNASNSFNTHQPTLLKLQGLSEQLGPCEMPYADVKVIKTDWEQTNKDFEQHLTNLHNEITEERGITGSINKIINKINHLKNDVLLVAKERLTDIQEKSLPPLRTEMERLTKLDTDARCNRRIVARNNEPSLHDINNRLRELENAVQRRIQDLDNLENEKRIIETRQQSTPKNAPQILNPFPSIQLTPYSLEKKFDFVMSESLRKQKPFNEDFSSPIGRNQRVSYEGPSSLLRSLNEDKW